MRPGRLLVPAGFLLMAASLACGLGAAVPSPGPAPGEPEPVFAPTMAGATATQVGESEAPPEAPAPAIPERRRVTLEFPEYIRAGDSDIIRLTLEVDELGNVTPTAEISGNKVTGGTIEVPNLYETHNVIAEARLDMAGVEVRPQEAIRSPLAEGQAVTFYWSVSPGGAGHFKGTAWLFLRFVDKQTGEESQRAVSAQAVEIESGDLLGLPAGVARVTGTIGSVVGGILGFPFIDDLIKAILRRLKRK